MIRDSILFSGTILGTQFERENRSEPDVEIPPALVITDEAGGMWSLGSVYQFGRERGGQKIIEFNVIRNDVDTGEFAEKILYTARRGSTSTRLVWIFGERGWRHWNGRTFI